MIVTEWLPPAGRIKEVKGKRGWEKPDTTNSNAPGRQGGWVARNLISLLKSRDTKVRSTFCPCSHFVVSNVTFGQLQEATLSVLAALAKDNPSVTAVLSRPSPEQESEPFPNSIYASLWNIGSAVQSPLSTVLSLSPRPIQQMFN